MRVYKIVIDSLGRRKRVHNHRPIGRVGMTWLHLWLDVLHASIIIPEKSMLREYRRGLRAGDGVLVKIRRELKVVEHLRRSFDRV